MAHSRSAKKRIRQNLMRRAINRWRKRQVKGAEKAFDEAVHGGDAAKAGELYRATTKVLDQVAAKGTIHKNAAARKKSRLAKRLNAMAK
ncbi:MAG: 30S ribosomal protein S20 [Phycisphaera sp.]|nr:30S ribosomal protein S20 [Phycisphaera sp.]